MHRSLCLVALVATAGVAQEPCKPAPRSASVEVRLPKGSTLKDLAAWYRTVTCDEVQAPLTASDVPLTLVLEGRVPAFRAVEVLRAAAGSAGYDVSEGQRTVTLEKAVEPCEPGKARALLERVQAAKECTLDLEAFGKVSMNDTCVDTQVTLEGATSGASYTVAKLKPGSLLWAIGLREGDVLPGAMPRGRAEFEVTVTRGKEQKTLRCRIVGEGRNFRLHPGTVLREALPRLSDFVPSGGGTCSIDPAAVTRKGDMVEIVESMTHGLDSTCFTSGARLVPSFKDGKNQGIKIFGIRPGSLYATLGLSNGDVVRSVNDLDFLDPQKVLEAYTTLRAVKTFVLKLERRGEPLTLTVVVK